MAVCVFVVDGYIWSGTGILKKRRLFKSLSRELIRGLMGSTIFSVRCT